MRYLAIALLFAAFAPGQVRAPEDVERLNEFAQQYNRYVQELRNQELDPKQWERVLAAWQRLQK